MPECLEKLFHNYDRFNDGLLLSFGFFHTPENTLVTQATFHARDWSAPDKKWGNVKIIMKDTVEFYTKWYGNQVNSICCGVKLLRFDDLWCLDVDGVYDKARDPESLDAVRQFGTCYSIGRHVEAFILENDMITPEI